MVPESFVVYGGGRWRAVDAASGSVSGWGRVRWAVARGGRLRALPARRALPALRALAAQRPSAAREGPKLEYRYPAELSQPLQPLQPGSPLPENYTKKHCPCCHHNDNGKNAANEKVSVAVQCEATILPQQLLLPSKRRRDSTSSERDFHTKVMTVAAVHSPKKLAKRRKTSISKNTLPSSDEITLETKKLLKSTHTMGPMKRKKSTSSDTQTPNTEEKNSMSKYLQPRSKKLKCLDKYNNKRQQNSSSETETSAQRSRRRSSSKSDGSSEWGNKKKSPKSNLKKQQNNNLLISSDSEADEPSKEKSTKKDGKTKRYNKATEKPSQESNLARDYQNSHKKLQAHGSCTELVIDESDVEILRLYLQNKLSDEELLRFDTDNNYKMIHFYKINPLVHLERCPRIARMLYGQEQMRLVDFASQLGLKSVSEASFASRRYRTRTRTRTRERKSCIDHTDSNTDKENVKIPTEKVKEAKPTPKSLRERNDNAGRYKHDIETDKYNNNGHKRNLKHPTRVLPIELSSADETGRDANEIEARNQKAEPSKQKAGVGSRQAVRSKPVEALSNKLRVLAKPKRPALKEYSSLEDHAIVSWLTPGARARQVNGNRLWRELEGQYPRLVGHGRTWHSLRNRYLRYILPRLGALALSPAHQARLRAAAATGELKSRKGAARRNSMFALPPRGAASRAPRPPPPTPTVPSSTNCSKKTTKASPPRYRDVTRRQVSPPRAPRPPRRPSPGRQSRSTQRVTRNRSVTNNKTTSKPTSESSPSPIGPKPRRSRSRSSITSRAVRTSRRSEATNKGRTSGVRSSPRLADRRGSSDSSSEGDAQTDSRPHLSRVSRMRRLFNPKAIM